VRRRTSIDKIAAQALVFLLLCGIVAGEFPELLLLTDNASNDFTVRNTNSVVLPVLRCARRIVRMPDDLDIDTPAPHLPFSRLYRIEEAALIHSDALVLHSVLRT
jgi:hypothetical protein